MTKYIFRRIGLMIPVIFGVLVIVFIINRMAGDPVVMLIGSDATEEEYASERERLGLDKPVPVQFYEYVKGVVTRFDLGTSFVSRRPVSEQILVRFPTTLRLALISLCISSVLGIAFGVVCAINQNTKADYIVSLLAMIVASLPNFWFALMMILFFAVNLGILPATGLDEWKGWVLPAVVLGLGPISNLCRTTRSSMLEVIRQDYIRTAKSKGISDNKVIFKHTLKNALFPVITVFGLMASLNIGGQVVVETIFTIPGIGSYMMTSITNKDYPVVQGTVIVLSLMVCVINLLVDIAYGFADPRIRLGYASNKKSKRAKKPARIVEVAQ